MSMSSRIIGVRNLEGRFAKMMQVKLACEAAAVEYPDEVRDYFFEHPSESEEYLRSEMEEVDISGAVTRYSKAEVECYDVNLWKLSDAVKAIRFENSW